MQAERCTCGPWRTAALAHASPGLLRCPCPLIAQQRSSQGGSSYWYRRPMAALQHLTSLAQLQGLPILLHLIQPAGETRAPPPHSYVEVLPALGGQNRKRRDGMALRPSRNFRNSGH